MSNARFKKGSAAYRCRWCSLRTRETGERESSERVCAFCYLVAGLKNSVADGCMTQDEFNTTFAALVKRHNRNADGTPRTTTRATPTTGAR